MGTLATGMPLARAISASHASKQDHSLTAGAQRSAHSVALFAMYYNFVRLHKTLRTTPAMAAKVTERLWEMGDIVDVLEAWEAIK
jgi:hypothetical protein